MNILMVSSYLPYPLYDGGRVRLYNIIKELSRRNKITLICEMRSHQNSSDVEEIRKYCAEVITVIRPNVWSLQNIIRTGFSTFPLLMVSHTNRNLKKKIVEALNTKHFDIIHIETFYVYQNLPKTYLPVVLVDHNIEYEVYARYMKSAPVYLRPFLFVDIQKMKLWERRYWNLATRSIAVSIEDRKKMGKDTVVVSNGVDVGKFRMKSLKTKNGGKKKILFMGDFRWIQNRNSAEWILKDIWPRMQEESDLSLWIVGRKIPDDIKALGSEGVVFDEHQEDTVKVYQNSYVLLAPIRVGGGTSYKIIEAMASGVPVVATNLSAKALGLKDGKEVLIAEDSEGLAKAVLKLVRDEDLYVKLRISAREFVESHYSWESITKTLEGVYAQVIRE